MKYRYSITASLFILFLISTLSYGKSETPEALAREYFSILQSEGVASIARLMHPDALLEFKSMLLPVYEEDATTEEHQLINMTFGPKAQIADIRKMEPEAFMNGFLTLVAAGMGGGKVYFSELEVLGTIAEGDARHVLTRMTIGVGEMSVSQFEVLSFLPYKGTWRLQLNGEMKGLARTFQSRVRNQ